MTSRYEKRDTPLGELIKTHMREWMCEDVEVQSLMKQAAIRCSSLGALQYVDDSGHETYAGKDVHDLVIDVQEELADACAYIVALIRLDSNYSEVIYPLALVAAKVYEVQQRAHIKRFLDE